MQTKVHISRIRSLDGKVARANSAHKPAMRKPMIAQIAMRNFMDGNLRISTILRLHGLPELNGWTWEYRDEDSLTRKSLWRGVPILILSWALAAPARTNTSLKTAATEIVIGIVAVAAGATVLVVVLIHKSKKTAITGCVNSAENGMTITDEKDRQIYALSGKTMGIKQGTRLKLRGKRVKSQGADKTFVWEQKR